MTNAEIRRKALSKVKVKNLTTLAFLSAVALWLAQLTRGIGANPLSDAAIQAGAAVVVSLLFPAGLTRVSMGAWRQNEAKFSAFFSFLYRPRLFLRGLLLGLVAGAWRLGFSLLLTGPALARILSLPGRGIWLLPLAAAVLAPLLFLWIFLYFALELGSGFRLGLRTAFQNLGRILEMELSLLWWVALVYAAAVAISLSAGLGGAALNAVCALVGISLTWMIGAYVCLANAGLAREIHK